MRIESSDIAAKQVELESALGTSLSKKFVAS